MTSTKDQRGIIIQMFRNVIWWKHFSESIGQTLFDKMVFSEEQLRRQSQKEKQFRLLKECESKGFIKIKEIGVLRKSRRFRIWITEEFKPFLSPFEDQISSIIEPKYLNNKTLKKLEFPFVDLLLKGIIKEFNP